MVEMAVVEGQEAINANNNKLGNGVRTIQSQVQHKMN